jgi:hypothetical protein
VNLWISIRRCRLCRTTLLTGSCLRSMVNLLIVNSGVAMRGYLPTLDVASVKLLSVVLFPDEGLPTRPIKGSRGIVSALQRWLRLHRDGVVASRNFIDKIVAG